MKKYSLLAIALLLASLALSQDKKETESKPDLPVPEAKTFKSTQSVTIDGRSYSLNTEVGTHLLRDTDDKPLALFGFTYYKLAGAKNRPIIFAFNGGPLSASFWLHFGILGPRRVVVNDPDYTVPAPYIAAYLDYLYETLGADRSMTYVTSTGLRDGFRWDWKHRGNDAWGAQVAISTLPDMATAMKRNPGLKILIPNGYYDLATVFYGVEYSVSHMDLPSDLQNNIIMKYYEAGHMMYTHEPSMKQFREEAGAFISETSN